MCWLGWNGGFALYLYIKSSSHFYFYKFAGDNFCVAVRLRQQGISERFRKNQQIVGRVFGLFLILFQTQFLPSVFVSNVRLGLTESMCVAVFMDFGALKTLQKWWNKNICIYNSFQSFQMHNWIPSAFGDISIWGFFASVFVGKKSLCRILKH